MPQRRPVTSRSQEPRRRFAEELKALRGASGESLRQPADKLGEAGDIRGEELAQQVEARLGRAGLLTREGGPHFRTILYEAVLRMALREKGAWREQSEYLLKVSEHPYVTIQVCCRSAPGRAAWTARIRCDARPGPVPRRVAEVHRADGGQCLEVADNLPVIPVRDSKNPHGPALVFPVSAWVTFVTTLRN